MPESIDELLTALPAIARAAPPAMARATLTWAVRSLSRASAPAMSRASAPAMSRASAPAIPACHWRGALIERAACGCADRNIYQCKHPAAAIDGKPAPVLGADCARCKYRATPKK